MSGFRWPRTFARSVLDSKMFNKNLRRWLSKLFERVSNLSKDYFFSQCYGENLQRYSSVRVELHVRACLRTFEKFLSDTFFLICPSLFVEGNILSLLSDINPSNHSASVFARVYTHERRRERV